MMYNLCSHKVGGLALALVLAVVAASMTSCITTDAANKGYVYECKGPKSKVYHTTPDCKGLNKCSTRIVKTSRQSTRRRPCKICAR